MRDEEIKARLHLFDLMRVYLSVPMVANRSLDRANIIAEAIMDSGHEVISPWVLGSLDSQGTSDVNVFERDRNGAESCDAIVADITEPSIGVGMELMAAHKAGKRIVLLARRGQIVSKMLLHLKDKETFEFDEESQIYPGLIEILGTQHPGQGTNDLSSAITSLPTTKKEIRVAGAPSPVGPYSQGIDAGGIYCAGQLGIDPKTGNLEDGIASQTRRALTNLAEVLAGTGLGLKDIVKTTVFLTDLGDYQEMNDEYSKHFSAPYPARTTVQAAGLPRGAKVEIDAIAVRP